MRIEPSQRSLYQAFYAVIKRIPKGQVATYRQIAQLSEHTEDIRQVGYALAEVTDPAVPWHRVINSDGQISQRVPLETLADSAEYLRLICIDICETECFPRQGRAH